jgi:hypothetical protein
VSKKTKIALILAVVILVAALVVVVRLIGLGLVAAIWDAPVEPDLDLVFDIALREQDLPSGWVLIDAGIEEIPGGEGRIYDFAHRQFQGQMIPPEFIREHVLVYPDEEAAIDGFLGIHDDFLPSEIAGDAPELMILHSADEMEVGCYSEPYERAVGDFCVSISRYGRAVILLGGKIRYELLTTEVFRDVLEVSDQRATSAIDSRQ